MLIAYPDRSLHRDEQSMRIYSSAKLELLTVKWVLTEKIKDYFLGPHLLSTDNNLAEYSRESKLGVV